jgi:hypothetical protein
VRGGDLRDRVGDHAQVVGGGGGTRIARPHSDGEQFIVLSQVTRMGWMPQGVLASSGGTILVECASAMVEFTSSTTTRSPIPHPATRACGGPPNSCHIGPGPSPAPRQLMITMNHWPMLTHSVTSMFLKAAAAGSLCSSMRPASSLERGAHRLA